MKHIDTINEAVQRFFEAKKDVNIIPAKKLMPDLIAHGVFVKDVKNGQPLRKLLRQIDEKGKLDTIPSLHVVRKGDQSFWYFKREGYSPEGLEVDKIPAKTATRKELKKLEIKEEQYVIDLCDEALGMTASRQHKFDFLLGDLHRNGKTRSQIPCDAYYPDIRLVVEFHGYPHSKDSKDREAQTATYDERKKKVLPEHKIKMENISFELFDLTENQQIKRNHESDLEKVKDVLKAYQK